ncbi:MAG: alpha/beta hydrolase family esterase [Fimbriimonas sp.]
MFSLLGLLAMVPDAGPALVPYSVDVEGRQRQVLVAKPLLPDVEAPLVFAFHGHGGNAQSAARKFQIEKHWPEAVVVYMQGQPSVGQSDPKGLRNGWQKSKGDIDDRDLKFFNKTLDWAKKEFKVDPNRIYSMGHSNGGGFTYLLWANNPELFAAIGVGAGGFRGGVKLKPVPVMHVAGEKDTTVPYANQVRTVSRVRAINGCDVTATRWQDTQFDLWPSKLGAPVVFYSYPGTHKFPDNGGEMMVRFFKEHSKPRG